MEFIFTLKYQLSNHDRDHDELAERLGAAGCDDALIGIGLPDRLALEFTRTAGDAGAAIRSALADVKEIIPSARLIEAGPDLVGLTDIANTVGISRQAMRKLMLANRSSFPPPVHSGSKISIWHLAEVLDWLKKHRNYPIDSRVLDISRAALEVNIAKESARHLVVENEDLSTLTA